METLSYLSPELREKYLMMGVPEEMLGLLPPLAEMMKKVPPSSARVILARHADPYDYTAGRRVPKVYGNHARQVWLTTKGIEQAYAGRDFFCSEIGRPSKVIHSPLPRAWQTAMILMSDFFVGPPPFVSDDDIDDIRLGPWLDVPRKDWTSHRTEVYFQLQLRSLGLNEGGPENPFQTQSRLVCSFFNHVEQHNSGLPLLIVSHGDPLCFLFQYLRGDEIMHLVDYRIMSRGKFRKVDKCTIWEVRLLPDSESPAEVNFLFDPDEPDE